jgi:6,7-dimethyl-8-ribityllumazine synthase
MSNERPARREIDGRGLSFAIICSRFNGEITEALLSGAQLTLRRHGVEDETIEIFYVPGAFEIPLLAKRLAGSGKYQAVITLGAVVRGDTGHYELVANEVASGIARASFETNVPVIFGVLATETMEQARRRSGGELGNRGGDAALAAIEMAAFYRDTLGFQSQRHIESQ